MTFGGRECGFLSTLGISCGRCPAKRIGFIGRLAKMNLWCFLALGDSWEDFNDEFRMNQVGFWHCTFRGEAGSANIQLRFGTRLRPTLVSN